jgi:dienelactone hydrolase
LIKKQTANKKNLEATIYEQAGHGFFEPTIQHFFPSPLFRPAPALASLRIVLKLIGG